jgi:hypothetical protein
MTMQALLSAALPGVAALAADPFAAVCADAGIGGTGSPSRHDPPCATVCAANGHGLAGPPPPENVIALALPQTAVARDPRREWRPLRVATRESRSPRGPPFA